MASSTPIEPTGHSAFFYGTLMAPSVLHRVCHGIADASNPLYATHNLKTYPAILHNHRRHRVKQADYPGVVPCPNSSVRGTFVTGLTEADIFRLDIFEGSEYERRPVSVKVLKEEGDAETGEGNVEGEALPAETYIWTASRDDLEDCEWDFAEFRREKERYWVGAEGAGEYAEVDEAVAAAQEMTDGTRGRAANGGHITEALLEEQKKKSSV
ncbi:hypothetical protein BST61_g5755 [Cercospora zeina]